MSDQALHPVNPPFPEFFLKVFGNSGTLPYKMKCLSIGPAWYILGLVVTYFSNSLKDFITDYGYLAYLLTGSFCFCAIIYACHQINPTLNKLDVAIKHTGEKKKYAEFLYKADYKSEAMTPMFWYYLELFIAPSFLVIIAFLGFIGPPWLSIKGGIASYLYYYGYLIIMGVIIGASFWMVGYYAFNIDDYCRTFLLSKKIDYLKIDQIEGLRPLGSLALRFNVALIIPSVAILIGHLKLLYENPELFALRSPIYMIMLAAYVAVLSFIFFFPLRNAHKSLATAKKKTIGHLREMITDFYRNGAQENPEKLAVLNGLLATHTYVKGMSTWPMNFPTLVSALMTFLTPLVGGVVLQILLETTFLG